MKLKLNSVIGYDFRRGEFTVGTHRLDGNEIKASDRIGVTEREMDAYLARYAPGGGATNQDRADLIAAVMEPIAQVVDYMQMYDIFFMPWNVTEGEDNKIALEDIVTLAWETHEDSAVLYLRPGFLWTRPDFTTYDTGVEIHWETMAKAGWNVLARQMKRAAENLARKRDEFLKGALEAAYLSNHITSVSGGTITKAAVDAVLVAQATIGFPVTQALINPGILMGMGSFNWNGGTNVGLVLPPDVANDILRTLVFMNYGGVTWYSNPFAPVGQVVFSCAPSYIGYHQTRGEMKSASDTDITDKLDRHAIYDQEHAVYVQNPYALAKLTINP
jgi:hypothetical protein